jgi:Family of unknown function (DUF5696)
MFRKPSPTPVLFCAVLLPLAAAQTPSPADTGAPQVTVTHANGTWTIRGRKNTVKLNESNLAASVEAGPVRWKMVPSSDRDMRVSSGSDEFYIRLADAQNIQITPYQTGFKTGVRMILEGFRNTGVVARGALLNTRVVLTLCLEGNDEDLVAEAVVNENGAAVKELNWPKELDGRDVDYTVISSDNGTLLPRDWPKPYHPIHRAPGDHSIIQSHLIESWAMSWWGFEKGDSAMIVIVETPDDAAYTFSHPAGGPTTMGPSWLAQLGHFGYLRSVRMCFLPKGNYVDLSKRYRRYVTNSGLYVSLKDKIARTPAVANLIDNPMVGLRVLTNIKPGSAAYDTKDPAKNYHVTTFAENMQRMRELKAQGWQHLNVTLSAWLHEGYDRQTPDALPPPEKAGGWEGMKAFFNACKELGYTCWLHDQYRDYYLDAPSWNPDFAVHEEDTTTPPDAFPGTRFKNDWKQGYIPLMDHWEGGPQGYLNSRFMLGHLVKNYDTMFAHGIHPQGSYLDVFGYIPPDQDFNPNHPNTRTDSMNYRAGVFHWVKNNLGIVGTEAGSDWVIPYVDYTTPRANRGANTGTDPAYQDAIQVPLYSLVYHDAVVSQSSPANLHGFLYGDEPQLSGRGASGVSPEQVRRMAALHKRVGMLEMTNHEFLDKDRRLERTTFADGTTVTVDWTRNTVTIRPDVEAGK